MPRTRPIRLQDLFELNIVGAVSLSPDAETVVFEQTRFDLEENKNVTNLMMADTSGGDPRPLTQGTDVNRTPLFSPDGGLVAFVSNREKANCLYLLPMTGGEPRRLTDRDGNVADFAWSPDGKRLVYTYQPLNEAQKLERDEKREELKKRPTYKHITLLHHKLDGAGFWNGRRTHVYVVSVAGGKPRRLTDGDYDHREPRFSPDGKLVSFVSNRREDRDLYPELTDIYTVPARGGRLRKVTRGTGVRAGHAFSPDGKWIAYIGNPSKPAEPWPKYVDRVWLVPAAGGNPRELTTDIDNEHRNLTLGDTAAAGFEACPPIWSPDSRRVHFLVSEAGCCHLYARDVSARRSKRLTAGEINIMTHQRTGGAGMIALTIGDALNPGDVYLFDPDVPGEPRRVTRLNASLLGRLNLSEPERFTVHNGKQEVAGWLLKPPDFDARRKYPAILEIHGGPHAQYGCAFFHEMQWLAASGYVVCYSNPRGSAGYGLRFMREIRADWGNHDYQDLMKVTDYLARRGYVDSKRIGVTGGSYGGYMTSWIISHTNRFKAAVTQRCVSSFETMFGMSDFGLELGLTFGGRPWNKRRLFQRQSPLTYVDQIRTPLLIIHSEQDLRCPVGEAEQLFTALRVLGREVEFIRFEGESHGLSRGGRPQNRRERLARLAGWFEPRLTR